MGTEPPEAKRVGDVAPALATRDVFCYFDNDAKMRAPFDAAALISRVRVTRERATLR